MSPDTDGADPPGDRPPAEPPTTTGPRPASLPAGCPPGAILAAGGADVDLRPAAPRSTLRVRSLADRPVQVGSHFHVAEVNRDLDLDREAAWGMRLAIPSGTAVRFEPGEARDVELVPIGGARVLHGLQGVVEGPLDAPGAKVRGLAELARRGFAGAAADGDASADHPTTGDPTTPRPGSTDEADAGSSGRGASGDDERAGPT